VALRRSRNIWRGHCGVNPVTVIVQYWCRIVRQDANSENNRSGGLLCSHGTVDAQIVIAKIDIGTRTPPDNPVSNMPFGYEIRRLAIDSFYA
jgi:hypothetical protein